MDGVANHEDNDIALEADELHIICNGLGLGISFSITRAGLLSCIPVINNFNGGLVSSVRAHLHKVLKILRCHRDESVEILQSITTGTLVLSLDHFHVPPVAVVTVHRFRLFHNLDRRTVQLGSGREVANLHEISRIDEIGHARQRRGYHRGFFPFFRVGRLEAFPQQISKGQIIIEPCWWLLLRIRSYISRGIDVTVFLKTTHQ